MDYNSCLKVISFHSTREAILLHKQYRQCNLIYMKKNVKYIYPYFYLNQTGSLFIVSTVGKEGSWVRNKGEHLCLICIFSYLKNVVQ